MRLSKKYLRKKRISRKTLRKRGRRSSRRRGQNSLRIRVNKSLRGGSSRNNAINQVKKSIIKLIPTEKLNEIILEELGDKLYSLYKDAANADDYLLKINNSSNSIIKLFKETLTEDDELDDFILNLFDI